MNALPLLLTDSGVDTNLLDWAARYNSEQDKQVQLMLDEMREKLKNDIERRSNNQIAQERLQRGNYEACRSSAVSQLFDSQNSLITEYTLGEEEMVQLAEHMATKMAKVDVATQSISGVQNGRGDSPV